MALTTSTPRVTRSKRLSEGNGGEKMGSTLTSATATTTTTTTVVKKTTKVSAKSKATIKNSSTVITNTKTTKSTRAARTTFTLEDTHNTTEKDTNITDHEKENIDPLTGLDPLQTLALKSGKKKGLGVNGRGGNVAVNTQSAKSKPSTSDATTTTKTTTRARKPRLSIPVQDETETIAGRLVAMRRREAPEDRLARELTVRPLVDLSEAYGIAERPIVPSKEVTEQQATNAHAKEEDVDEYKEPFTHELIAADLHTALRLLAQTTDEHRRLPTVLQRPARGVKRALDSPATSGPSRASTSSENTSALRRLSEQVPSSSLSRPTKRMRKSAPGTATPKFTSTSIEFDVETFVPRAPPNSPVRVLHALPLPSAAEEIPTSVASTSRPIAIPSSSRRNPFNVGNDEETQETSFENTQGSSHFSSIFGSGSFRLGASFNVPSSFEVEKEEEERVDVGESWSRWL